MKTRRSRPLSFIKSNQQIPALHKDHWWKHQITDSCNLLLWSFISQQEACIQKESVSLDRRQEAEREEAKMRMWSQSVDDQDGQTQRVWTCAEEGQREDAEAERQRGDPWME